MKVEPEQGSTEPDRRPKADQATPGVPGKDVVAGIGSEDDKFRYPNFGTVVTAFEGP